MKCKITGLDESKPLPLDLRKLYGNEFRIDLDESAFCPGERRNNPWYLQIPCECGHIYPYSDRLLAFYCTSGKIRANLHRDHPDIEVRQWSDIGEAVFLYNPGSV